MALIDDYKKSGFNQWLEKKGSLLEGFESIQFFKTGSIAEDGTEEIEEISSGLVTLKTDKLGSQEIKEQIGQLNQFAGGDVTQPINVVFGHIQSANFVTGSGGAGWRIDSDGNLEANTGTFRGSIAATSGTIAAFTIASTTITATNLTLTSGVANTANITVGSGSNAGGINSADVAGDIVFWAGDTHANRATADFFITAAGALTATDATLTGTIKTASGTGARIEITSANNDLTLFNSSNVDILDFGSISSIVLRIFPLGSNTGLLIQNNDGNTLTGRALDVNVLETGSTAVTGNFQSNGTGKVVTISTGLNSSRTAPLLDILAFSTQGAHIHMNPVTSAPASPTEGDLYMDTDGVMYVRSNTDWAACNTAT